MQKPYIFFDVGGVLVTRNTRDATRIARILNVTEEEYSSAFLKAIEIIEAREPGVFWTLRTLHDEIEYLNRYHKCLISLLDLDPTEELVIKCTMERVKSDFSLVDGLTETLDELCKSHNLAIISNALPSRRFHELRFENIDQYFYPIVISTEVGIHKPARALFEYALMLSGAQPKDSYFVDDNLDNINTAIELGFKKVFHITQEISDNVKENVIMCKNISEIIPYV